MKKSLKRIISVVLSLCMLFVSASISLAADDTSTAYRYPDKYKLTRKNYDDFRHVIRDRYSKTAIPGLEKTVFPGKEECSTMVPQGLCFANEYMLITAYDYEKKFNSVIYVVSVKNETKPEYKGMIVLPDKNHSGGICFDGNYIFVARSSKKAVGAIPFEKAIKAAETGCAVLEDFEFEPKCDTTASFVTCFDGLIWVGLFDEENDGVIIGYELLKDNSFEKKKEMVIPKNTQGGAFTNYAGKTYFAASVSYGRKHSSKICIYEADIEKESLTHLKTLVFPPMAEEVEFYNGRLYVMFESAATEYSTRSEKCEYPTDRVCAAETKKLLKKNYSFFDDIIVFFEALFDRILNIFNK